MAKIVTITNPLTGQPAQVDQLDHTAQQIDDAIARALPGGAIDIALANNDPRKWGLGKDGIPVVNKATLDGLFTPGWYMFYDVNNPLDNGVSIGLVEIKGRNTDYTGTCVQEIWTQDVGYIGKLPYKAERLWDGSEWTPLEWFNNPMSVGVEYRTTERYLGKPVYVKVVNFGELPNTTGKAVSGWTENAGYIVSYSIILTNGANVDGWYEITNVFINSGEIIIGTRSDQSAFSAYVTVYYTKTTD